LHDDHWQVMNFSPPDEVPHWEWLPGLMLIDESFRPTKL